MSQPSPSFSRTTEDSFLSSLNQEQLSQADFQELFGPGTSDQDVFSSSNEEVFGGIGLVYEGVSVVPVDSMGTSAGSTPDFSSYSFGQRSSAYPTPEPDKPHPYPFESQRTCEASTPRQVLNHRSLHVRTQTNDVCLYSAPLSQPGLRRRSLSHSDVDRFAPTARMPNPTFIRLQAPRTRTTIAEKGRRGELHSRYGNDSCWASAPRGRSMEPMSNSHSLHSSPLMGGMLLTPIGTPLNKGEDTNCDTDILHHHHSMKAIDAAFALFPGDPMFRQMSHPEELARSQQIIEIGALAVTHHTKVDPRLEQGDSISDRDFVLSKLMDIEEHVKKVGDMEALRSCNTIRKVLTGNTQRGGETNVVDNVLTGDIDASRNDTTDTYSDAFDGRDDNEVMATLMKEHGAGDSSIIG